MALSTTSYMVLAIRLANAFLLRTFFQPDEYFQCLEPAWRLALGPQSHAWLTWEWKHRLRSSIHPALFSAAYLAADNLPACIASRTTALLAAPRILQAVIAALGDVFTGKLAALIYGFHSPAALTALTLQLASPWQWYVSTRTFSNSLETSLTVMALYFWPWQLFMAEAVPVKQNSRHPAIRLPLSRLRASLCLAALAVLLRPTNVLIWLTIAAVSATRIPPSSLLLLVREAVVCGSLLLALSLVSDRLYFGVWTVPAVNWLNFNISKSLAVFYGRNPWHYYLVQAIPLLSTTSLPFILWAIYRPLALSRQQANTQRCLVYAVAVTITVLSLISHKEVRFIYPLLPILNVIAAPRVASFFTSSLSSPSKAPSPRIRNTSLLAAALVVNVVLAAYLSILHQPAPLSVMTFLRTEYERTHPSPALAHSSNPSNSDDLFALFLTPCHSTPWRSHLIHPHLTAYALSCEPPLHTAPNSPERADYRDQADRFYDDPDAFLRLELVPSLAARPPRYVVGFEGIEPLLHHFATSPEAKSWGVRRVDRVWTGFNGFFNEDWRRRGSMVVWDLGARDEDQTRI
ncbi:hypothetical protein CDD82_6483 [Ophiocordyceps australis]|uniref:Mannosyltransferase n=1 Tax=Ophiocordyceps australis TaxID=1399860 RepID=A0A2C5YV31_9HYPO|nr:hypothetical protein CDD82_6483 [Ophiocordyceps australis]